MRRSWVIVAGTALVLSLSSPGASAQPERYASRSYNAFWHLTHRVDSDTYVRVTWYASVYEQADGFWSDL